jgi:sporulation protein YlmC with PRC-barrel domain
MHPRRVSLGIAFLLLWVVAVPSGAVAQDVPLPLQKMQTIIGHTVEDQRGKDMAHIKDVMIDAATGDVAYAVLAFGGVARLGEKLFAVPWQVLQQPTNTDTFRLEMTAEQLKNAPAFDENKWPDMEDRHWVDAVHAYYGKPPALGKQLPPKTGDERGGHVPHRFLRATYVLRSNVINTHDQRLGDIKEVVIDTTAGKVTYVVLAFGGAVGLGEKYFAIPWQALQQAAGLGTFTLDVDKDVLQEAPGFDKDHWPKTASPITK